VEGQGEEKGSTEWERVGGKRELGTTIQNARKGVRQFFLSVRKRKTSQNKCRNSKRRSSRRQ